jgi:SAM-dependent methyltransferase
MRLLTPIGELDLERALARVGYFGAPGIEAAAPEATVPAESRSYLQPDNPRLLEIRSRYKSAANGSLSNYRWTEEYVHKEVSLTTFRADSAFLWQIRDYNFPIHYALTYYFLRQSCAADLLAFCVEDALFGVSSIQIEGEHISRDRLDSVNEIAFLRQLMGLAFDTTIHILDIGSGYGRFAHRISQCFPRARVFCVDTIPESSFICEYYLRYRGADSASRVVELPEARQLLSGVGIDLAIAINSLSECDSRAVEWWMGLLRDCGIRHLLVVPHSARAAGRSVFVRDENSRRHVDMDSVLAPYGFTKVLIAPKYENAAIQDFGVSPTYYHLYEWSS